MEKAIQEEEMHFTSQHCKNNLKELADILVNQTSAYNRLLSECQEKIETEQNHIAILESKTKECQNYIQAHEERLSQIPGEIESLKEEIIECRIVISNLEIPVYYWEYSEYGSYRCVDYEATRSNEDYRDFKEQQIADCEKSIENLKKEAERRKKNIQCLNEMINQIGECINKKKELINLIKKDVAMINDSFKEFKKTTTNEENNIKEINNKVVQCAQYIHDLGTTLAKLHYQNGALSYSSKNPFVLNSVAISQEMQLLKDAATIGMDNVSNCSKATIAFSSDLEDEVTKSAKVIMVKSLSSLKKINENYIENQRILKTALDYMLAYEKINF